MNILFFFFLITSNMQFAFTMENNDDRIAILNQSIYAIEELIKDDPKSIGKMITTIKGGKNSKDAISKEKIHIEELFQSYKNIQYNEEYTPCFAILYAAILIYDILDKIIDNPQNMQTWLDAKNSCTALINENTGTPKKMLRNLEYSLIHACFTVLEDPSIPFFILMTKTNFLSRKYWGQFKGWGNAYQSERYNNNGDNKDHLNRRLIQAIQLNNNLNLVKALIDRGAKVNLKDKHRHSVRCKDWEKYEVFFYREREEEVCDCHPLIIAAEIGSYDICSILLEKGAPLNTTNCWGRTALYQAAKEGHENIVNLLAPSTGDKSIFILNQQLIKAISLGSETMVNKLLTAGAQVNPTNKGNYLSFCHEVSSDKCDCIPLILAIKLGFSNICRMLIAAGADVNSSDCFHRTPLFFAASTLNMEMVRMLISANVNINKRILFRGRDITWEVSVLDYLLRRYNNSLEMLEIIEILVNQNAQITSSRYNGSSLELLAMHIGYRNGILHPLHDKFVQNLLEIPDSQQSKRLMTFLLCCRKMGAYKDIIHLLKAPLIFIIKEENRRNTKSIAYSNVEKINSASIRKILIKRHFIKETPPDSHLMSCISCTIF